MELFNGLVRRGKIYDLSWELGPSTPIFPFHVSFALALHRRHGDTTRPGDSSFANELIVMTAHSSTHLDAIGHFSRAGRVANGRAARDIESDQGLTDLDIAQTPPVWRRGILLDVARGRGVDSLIQGDGIGATDLEEAAAAAGVSPSPSDVVLVRTGWAKHWEDHDTFNGLGGGYPGLDPEGARWLIQRKVSMVGSDTPAVEVAPPREDSVHAMLLVDSRIQMIENLNLEMLAEERVVEFLFVALPLRIVGATASPIRPIALC